MTWAKWVVLTIKGNAFNFNLCQFTCHLSMPSRLHRKNRRFSRGGAPLIHLNEKCQRPLISFQLSILAFEGSNIRVNIIGFRASSKVSLAQLILPRLARRTTRLLGKGRLIQSYAPRPRRRALHFLQLPNEISGFQHSISSLQLFLLSDGPSYHRLSSSHSSLRGVRDRLGRGLVTRLL